MRSRLSCAVPLMQGLDERGRPIGALPNDPLNIPYDEVLRRLPRPKIILRVNSKDQLSSRSRSGTSVSSNSSKGMSQHACSDTDSHTSVQSDIVSEDSEHDRILWKMPLWRKGSIIAGPSSLMYRAKGGQGSRCASTTSSSCSPKTIPKKPRGCLIVMLRALPRLDTSYSYIYD